MNELYSKIYELCKERKINISTMCRESGANRASFTDLKNNRIKKLSSDTLSKVSLYFGVSVDYLLGNTDEKRPAPGRPIAIMGADTKHGGVRMVDTPEGAKISEIRDYLDRFTLDQLNDVLKYVKFLDSKE